MVRAERQKQGGHGKGLHFAQLGGGKENRNLA
jgi:hypothetical protein